MGDEKNKVLWGSLVFVGTLMHLITTQATECIVTAEPRGGSELTCELLRSGIERIGAEPNPIKISYLPGGIGAMAFKAIISKRSAEPDTFVAFSGATLLAIAQKKFGSYTEQDIRWLAVLGVDYGALIVRDDSPLRSLNDLTNAVRKDPDAVVFGGSGGAGGQSWAKLATLMRTAKINYKSMRYVGFEGSGEALSSLAQGYIDVESGDVAEAVSLIRRGLPIRILAVFSQNRMPGPLKNVPTAVEQGYDVTWPNVRGVYMGPQVSDRDFRRWTGIMNKVLNDPAFVRLREEQGLAPYVRHGNDLGPEIGALVKRYAKASEALATSSKPVAR